VSTPVSEVSDELTRERRAAATAAAAFVLACQNGDVTGLYEAVDLIKNAYGGAWTVTMRKVVRESRTVSPKIQSAFLSVWIESNMLPLFVGDHRALCDAARLLLPSYQGPSVRLFRGAGAAERRRRIYGVSWSADVAVAERFARERRVMDGGSVLLETLAPSAGVICAVDYPKPRTQAEIEKLKRGHPNVAVSEFHEEREYVVDRRHLEAVTVVRRYSQIERASPSPQRVLS
jgi:hypothetical protein